MAAIEIIETNRQPRCSKPVRKRAIYYPTGDGKPMAEDTLHRKLMAYGCDALEYHFADRPDVYVAGNDFLYYEEGNVKARVSPDCYVVIGVEKKRRKSYKMWEENHIPPAVVFEFTSKATQKDDIETKRPLYEQRLRIVEYFQFDPTGDYLHPRLQGQRLAEGRYQNIELRDNRMYSEQLSLELVVEEERLRFYDPIRNEWLQTYEEAQAQRLAEAQRANAEAQRANAEAQRANAAEAALEQMRAEMEALRRQK